MPEITMTMDELQQLIRQEAERAVGAALAKYEKGVNADVAAEHIGVSVDTLMAEAKAFRVPHVRLRSRYIFHIPTLDRWMQEEGLLSGYPGGFVRPDERISRAEFSVFLLRAVEKRRLN